MLVEREEALTLSKSDAPHDRLLAARYFLRNYSHTDLDFLKSWATKENVGWVKRALEGALENINKYGPHPPTLEHNFDSKADTQRGYNLAVKEVASALLHELEPLIGMLGVKLRKEIGDYESSETKRHFDDLRLFFDALSGLRLASEVSKVEEFDLSVLVLELIKENCETAVEVHAIGPSECIIKLDKGLIKMAIVNGLRNAIEASVEATKDRVVKPIIINWGETDTDRWLAIIDDGVGLGRMKDHATTIGKTSKVGHFGMGLSIVKQAMESLEGTVSITSTSANGAIFELRWYKQ